MKCRTLAEWLVQEIEFKSRDEALFMKWCVLSGMEWEYEPRTIDGHNERWTPDFYLPQLNVYAEIKPVLFSYETRRVKRVVWAAVAKGERFWTWLVTIERGKPIIMELTESREGEEARNMQIFTQSGKPAEYYLPICS
jgi:hypothetical protein